jgi:Tfp pilus assembly protein PilF
MAEANHALRQHRPEHARQSLLRVLELEPTLVDAWRLMGAVQRTLGLHAEAVASLRRAIELDPDEPMTHLGLGISLHRCGEPDDALAEFQRACQLAPASAACWFNLGNALKLRGHQSERACDALERALRIDPGHVAARLTLAEAQSMLGRGDAATANYRDILRRQPANHHAWLGLAGTRTEPFSAHEASEIASLLHSADPSTEAGIVLGFALARAMEDQADYGAAFAALASANASRRRKSEWSATAETEYVDAIRHAFAQPRNDAPEGDRGSEVIFVVSMPRSGSTLVEQVLASHPQVEGAGEMTELQQVLEGESARRGQRFPHWATDASPADWARLGEDYLQRTAHWRQGRPRFTDKNLLNWKLVGAAMAMLPGAHVINVRRDPVETCLGCYRQLFRTGNDFSYDLGDLATYWGLYDRLCKHWRELYPQRFIELQYEDLVARPEAEIRRLLESCVLAFDPACLDFHKTQREIRTASAVQARQPLRRDTARSSHYGEALAPLRALLASVSR